MLQHARIVLFHFAASVASLYQSSVANFTLAADIIEASTRFYHGISCLTLYLSVCFIATIFNLNLYYRPRDFSDRILFHCIRNT